MDSYEATRMVFSRIRGLDPENASKIMGYLLLQDHGGEKEMMIRLAFGPEALLHNLIFKAKTHLGLSLSSSPTTPISGPNTNRFSRSASSSIAIGRGLSFEITNNNPPSPSPSPSNNPWPVSVFSSDLNNLMSPTSNSSPPYASDEVFDPRLELEPNSTTGYNETHLLHRRSYSVPGGVCFGSEDADSGFGWKPCLYFARGFCKNGSSCRFLHGDSTDGSTSIVGSPSNFSEFDQCQELLGSKAAAASHFMTGASFPYNKCFDSLLQQQQQQQSDSARYA